MPNKYKILFFDDNKGCTTLGKASLEKTNEFEVEIENDPKKWKAAFRRAKPDIILLDLMMPTLHGSKVAQGIRKINKTVPIVYFTGKEATKEDELTYNRRENREFLITKPIFPVRLRKRLVEILEEGY